MHSMCGVVRNLQHILTSTYYWYIVLAMLSCWWWEATNTSHAVLVTCLIMGIRVPYVRVYSDVTCAKRFAPVHIGGVLSAQWLCRPHGWGCQTTWCFSIARGYTFAHHVIPNLTLRMWVACSYSMMFHNYEFISQCDDHTIIYCGRQERIEVRP